MNKLLTLLALFLMACLQGPWDYNPDVTPAYRGVTVNAYVIADNPVDNVCFEKILPLDETYTAAFSWFESADVTITGEGGAGERTIQLAQDPNRVGCFVGPDDFLPQAGKVYQLEASITWDSSGVSTTTRMTSETYIPAFFSVADSAVGNSMVLVGSDPSSIGGAGDLFAGLPEKVQEDLVTIYGEDFLTLSQDTAALTEYFLKNGEKIQSDTDSLLLLYRELANFFQGDTITYLVDGLNTESHYFLSQYSQDIGGVLVTQRLDTSAAARSPQTRFDEIAIRFQGELDPSSLYKDSDIRRLINWPNYKNQSGGTVLDSIAVVNTWLNGGKNVFYFYAVDSAYSDFQDTYTQGQDNSKTKAEFNVEGAHGFFVGAIRDSFVVNVRIPPNHTSFSTIESKADFCNPSEEDKGDVNPKFRYVNQCYQFNQNYCATANYNDRSYTTGLPQLFNKGRQYSDCIEESIIWSWEKGQSASYLIDSLFPSGQREYQTRSESGEVKDGKESLAGRVENAEDMALENYCLNNDFVPERCSDLQSSFLKDENQNLFGSWVNQCEWSLWEADACAWAQALHCKNPSTKSQILCGPQNNTFCAENPTDPVCK